MSLRIIKLSYLLYLLTYLVVLASKTTGPALVFPSKTTCLDLALALRTTDFGSDLDLGLGFGVGLKDHWPWPRK